MTTASRNSSIRDIFNLARPDQLADVSKAVKLGTMLSSVKVVVTGLTAAAAVNISLAATKAAAVVTGLDLETDEQLPAIGSILALRVTAVGTAALGPRVVTDAGGTAGAPGANGPGIALISDAGNTLTFEGTVTAFVLEYMPRAAVPLNTAFPIGAP